MNKTVLITGASSGIGAGCRNSRHADQPGHRNNRIKEIKDFLIKSDIIDSKAQSSGWDLSLSYIADLLAHQGRPNRRFQRNLARFKVHLVRTHYLEFHTGICREIREFHRAQKAYPVFGKGFRINHTGIFQYSLQEPYTADGLRLNTPCFAISGILTPISLCTCLCNIFPYLWINHIDKVIQFRQKFVESLF